LEGSNITVTEATGNRIVINGVSNIVEADVLARNGMIYVVGRFFSLSLGSRTTCMLVLIRCCCYRHGPCTNGYKYGDGW
jgi:Fasciclin domain